MDILRENVSFPEVVRSRFERANKGNKRAAELLFAYDRTRSWDEFAIDLIEVRRPFENLIVLTTSELLGHLQQRLGLSSFEVVVT